MTTKKELLKTIRQHCINCCGGVKEKHCLADIENCTAGPEAEKAGFPVCALWAFRMGIDPEPAKSRQEAGKRAYERNKDKMDNTGNKLKV